MGSPKQKSASPPVARSSPPTSGSSPPAPAPGGNPLHLTEDGADPVPLPVDVSGSCHLP